jgi:hypothetical protein
MIEDAKAYAVKPRQTHLGSSPQETVMRLQQQRHCILQQPILDGPCLSAQPGQRRRWLQRRTRRRYRQHPSPGEGDRDPNLSQKPKQHMQQSNTE